MRPAIHGDCRDVSLGIEAAGVIEAAPGTDLPVGAKAVAMMGGMGRAFDGGYAEYTLVPAACVIPVETALAWPKLGSLPEIDGGLFRFRGDSDAMIVRGLIAILVALYSGLSVSEVLRVDAGGELARLGLNDHLSAQRSNGLRAMIERIRLLAGQAAA